MFMREAYNQLASWLNSMSLSLGISLDASKTKFNSALYILFWNVADMSNWQWDQIELMHEMELNIFTYTIFQPLY